MKLPETKSQAGEKGFTLLDLLVVMGVMVVLLAIQLPALAAAKSQTKIGICASHVRQLALACQMYAADNSDRLPVMNGRATWAWDVPAPVTDALLAYGLEKRTFYCPGTAPRFTDLQNWSAPGTGTGSTLWNYDFMDSFHVIGYALAFSGSASVLNQTNQNTTILPETIKLGSTTLPAPPASGRVLVADATISVNSLQPGYEHPENNYTSIAGGFMPHGVLTPHVSPHLSGNIPAGGNLGFKDGHVAWRQFKLMTPRTTAAACFWW